MSSLEHMYWCIGTARAVETNTGHEILGGRKQGPSPTSNLGEDRSLLSWSYVVIIYLLTDPVASWDLAGS